LINFKVLAHTRQLVGICQGIAVLLNLYPF
jgi:hypothetical protein